MMLMLGLNETIDQLAMAMSAHWCGHELRMENGCLEKGISFRLKSKRGRII